MANRASLTVLRMKEKSILSFDIKINKPEVKLNARYLSQARLNLILLSETSKRIIKVKL